MLTNISNTLNDKVYTIKSEGKTPIIFLLIGSCPDYSYIQQTPPVILEYIKDPNISPIVFIIDKIYENKPHTLDFLDLNITNFNEFNPGKWYYPNFIPKLKDSYQGKVAYQFYPQYIKDDEVLKFIQLKSVVDTMTLIWSFNGLTISPPFPINNYKMLIPEGNCMANTKYDSIYFPKIAFVDNDYFLIDMEDNFEEIVNDIHKYFNNSEIIDKNKMLQYECFVYYSLKRTIENFSTFRSWEIQIRVNDSSNMTLNKDSSQEDWDYFKNRVRHYFNIKKLYTKFMMSKSYTLSDFINSKIYDIGNQIIKLNLIEEKYKTGGLSDHAENNQLETFIQQYFQIINNNIRRLPDIFNDTFEKYKHKCCNIVNY